MRWTSALSSLSTCILRDIEECLLICVSCNVQEAAGFQYYALDLKNPDFVKYAEAYGAKGYRILEVCFP